MREGTPSPLGPQQRDSCDNAEQPAVCVIGDIIADRWCAGLSRRLAREAPVPVLELETEQVRAGGAGNTAVNLANLGVDVHLVGWVGSDRMGAAVLDSLHAAGVHTEQVLQIEGARTPTKSRFGVQQPSHQEYPLSHTLLRVDSPPALPSTLPPLHLQPEKYEALIVCDYGGGAYSEPTAVQHALADHRRPLVVVDSHRPERWHPLTPDLVTPNWQETAGNREHARTLASTERRRWVLAHAPELLGSWGARHAIVTLDVDGTILLGGPEQGHWTGGPPVSDGHTCGAGDSFLAGVCAALLADVPLWRAQWVGQQTADSALELPGTTPCHPETLERLGTDGAPIVADPASARSWLAARGTTCGAVTVGSGIFDDMHPGHHQYLRQAGTFGDTLVMGVNTDTSARQLRGAPQRCLAQRAVDVARHPSVDLVVLIEEPTAESLIEQLRPGAYVKGGDYTSEMVAERGIIERLGTRLKTLDYLAASSPPPLTPRAGGAGDK